MLPRRSIIANYRIYWSAKGVTNIILWAMTDTQTLTLLGEWKETLTIAKDCIHTSPRCRFKVYLALRIFVFLGLKLENDLFSWTGASSYFRKYKGEGRGRKKTQFIIYQQTVPHPP